METQKKKRIGIIGYGTIGSYLMTASRDRSIADVEYVYDLDEEKTKSVTNIPVLKNTHEIADYHVDLVIETATNKVVQEIASQVLTQTDLLIFSVTSLSNNSLRNNLQAVCKENNTRLYIPHGAILGLDGVHDGRQVLEDVCITTTKNPQSLGLEKTASCVIYDGPTRGACDLFPRNVNVHAALALVGLGFDHTRSVVVADPKTNQMKHDIHVLGQGLEWNISISSRSMGGVTGSYTPESAIMTVQRILATRYDIVLA
jgi:aspartate dehydrogenase